jgi:hypothetical protein
MDFVFVAHSRSIGWFNLMSVDNGVDQEISRYLTRKARYGTIWNTEALDP